LLDRAPDVVAQDATAGVHRVFHVGQGTFAGALVARDLFGVGAVEISAHGGDFNHLVLAAAAIDHVHDAKAPTNDEGPSKELFDLLGRGVGGHVKVFGAQPQQEVAHRAAHDVSLKARVFEGVDHIKRAVVDQIGVDAVHLDRNILPLAIGGLITGRAAAGGAGFAQQLVDEIFDHSKRFRMRQPRWVAMSRNRASGLVATGSCTRSSKGRSFMESL